LKIDELKRSIFREIGVLPDRQRLFYGGIELADKQTIKDHHIVLDGIPELRLEERVNRDSKCVCM
jgi:hypothetical protein